MWCYLMKFAKIKLVQLEKYEQKNTGMAAFAF